MPARRFFIEGTHADGDVVPIGGQDAHKIVRVLRLKSGDRIELVDSAATSFQAELRLDGESVHAVLSDASQSPAASAVQIDVAQAVPKSSKMDFIVEKLSELGVSAIRPFESERCVVRGAGLQKVERWRRIAISAAQQSGRPNVAPVEDVVDYDQLVRTFASYDVVLFPWEVAERVALRDSLPALIANARRILIVVGPEGGFSHAEAELAKEAGAHVISLGSQILRTETAALFVLSILAYLVRD